MIPETAPATPFWRVAPPVAEATFQVSWMYRALVGGVGFAASLLVSISAHAVAVAPSLGAAASYTALGTNAVPTVGTLTCTDTGPGTAINGDVGSTFTSITNTGCLITGAIITPVPSAVVTDFNNAYSALDSLNPVCDGVIPTVTATLAPGVYCSVAGTTIGAGVILTLTGTATDVWVFKIGTGGTGAFTGNSFQVVMGGTAQACNVYWRTAQSATVTDSNFQGTILSGAAFTMTRGSYLGRALATTDATVNDAGPMTFAGCGAQGLGSASAIPTMSQWMYVLLGMLLVATGWMRFRRR